jgi:hypothetical protein
MMVAAGLVGMVVLLAGLSVATLPAAAQSAAIGVSTCPVLDLANPSPGDVVNVGSYVVQGVAFDPITLSSTGISRIEFYLGTQDTGGTLLGTVVPSASPATGPNTFRTTLTFPDVSRDDAFNAIAFSATSGATTIVQRQIHVGATTPPTGTVRPTPSPVPLSITIKRGCPVAAPGPQLVATTTVPVISITQGQGPVLILGNPNANDVVSRGPLVVSGVAFDPTSTSGAGIAQVEFFLDDRDAGGVSLGGTTVPGAADPSLPRVFNTTVHIPTNTTGLHNFVTYAQSSQTGLETKVSVPVYIGPAPSPTPRS